MRPLRLGGGRAGIPESSCIPYRNFNVDSPISGFSRTSPGTCRGGLNFPPVSMLRYWSEWETPCDPEITLDRIAAVVGNEPPIASKLLRLANSVHYNPPAGR